VPVGLAPARDNVLEEHLFFRPSAGASVRIFPATRVVRFVPCKYGAGLPGYCPGARCLITFTADQRAGRFVPTLVSSFTCLITFITDGQAGRVVPTWVSCFTCLITFTTGRRAGRFVPTLAPSSGLWLPVWQCTKRGYEPKGGGLLKES
jgi:hypothetical protein